MKTIRYLVTFWLEPYDQANRPEIDNLDLEQLRDTADRKFRKNN